MSKRIAVVTGGLTGIGLECAKELKKAGNTIIVGSRRCDSKDVFSVKKNGECNDFIFGVITGVDGRRVGVNGVIVNPVGLKNKIAQGKTGERSR